MKRLISFLLITALLLTSAFSAGALTLSGGVEVANDFDDQLAVTGYSGTDPVVTIPETAYNKVIRRFDLKAFYNNQVVETVIMHDNMTQVKKWALKSCSNLKNVYFSKSLAVLYDQSFAYDPKLTSALLRNTEINELNVGVFTNSGVEYVALPDTLKSVYGTVFEKTQIRRINLPSGVTQVGNRCFANCEKLTEVYIPASVTKLGEDVFRNTPNVTVFTTEGSAAQNYCSENGVNCQVIGSDKFPSRLVGDVNGDGVVNINDVTFIQRELLGYKTNFYPDNCDFDGNCVFNIDDATKIQLRLVGLY